MTSDKVTLPGRKPKAWPITMLEEIGMFADTSGPMPISGWNGYMESDVEHNNTFKSADDGSDLSLTSATPKISETRV